MTPHKEVPDYLEDIVTHPKKGVDAAYGTSSDGDSTYQHTSVAGDGAYQQAPEETVDLDHLCTHSKHFGTCPACLLEGKS